MSTDLIRTNGVAAAPAYLVEFDRDKINLLKDTVAKGATDNELALFIEVCRRKNLDPFSKQIHMVKRWDATLKREVASFQVGIDGFRAQAERTGLYEGQAGPLWCGTDGKWQDVWLDSKPPAAAKVGVYRRGFREPLWGIALWREYVQTNREGHPNSMWSKMGTNQLAKCAEALALRKAFPEELAGTYTPDEMAQADSVDRSQAKHEQAEVLASKLAEVPAETRSKYEKPPVIEAQVIDDSDIPAVMGGTHEPEPGGRDRVAEMRQRHTEAAANAAPKPEPSIKDVIANFQPLKQAFADLAQPMRYYEALNREGCQNSQDVAKKGPKEARRIYKVVAQALADARLEAEEKAATLAHEQFIEEAQD